MSGVVKIRGEVAGKLGCPGFGRVVGDAEQVDAAGAVLDDECCVQALECDVARRTISVVISSLMGGRPGGFG